MRNSTGDGLVLLPVQDRIVTIRLDLNHLMQAEETAFGPDLMSCFNGPLGFSLSCKQARTTLHGLGDG